MFRAKSWATLLALVALTLLPVTAAAEQAPILIGVAGAHSGDLAPYGTPTKEAVEMLAAELNGKGGLLGNSRDRQQRQHHERAQHQPIFRTTDHHVTSRLPASPRLTPHASRLTPHEIYR